MEALDVQTMSTYRREYRFFFRGMNPLKVKIYFINMIYINKESFSTEDLEKYIVRPLILTEKQKLMIGYHSWYQRNGKSNDKEEGTIETTGVQVSILPNGRMKCLLHTFQTRKQRKTQSVRECFAVKVVPRENGYVQLFLFEGSTIDK